MAAESYTYTPAEMFAGDQPNIVTDSCTVKTGNDVAQLELMAFDTAGKAIPHPGTLTVKVAGLMLAAVDASAADTVGSLYTGGNFFSDKITWPASATTDLLKKALLAGTPLKATVRGAGE